MVSRGAVQHAVEVLVARETLIVELFEEIRGAGIERIGDAGGVLSAEPSVARLAAKSAHNEAVAEVQVLVLLQAETVEERLAQIRGGRLLRIRHGAVDDELASGSVSCGPVKSYDVALVDGLPRRDGGRETSAGCRGGQEADRKYTTGADHGVASSMCGTSIVLCASAGAITKLLQIGEFSRTSADYSKKDKYAMPATATCRGSWPHLDYWVQVALWEYKKRPRTDLNRTSQSARSPNVGEAAMLMAVTA